MPDLKVNIFNKIILIIIILQFAFYNCTSKSENISVISEHYKKHNDLKSLKKLVMVLKTGMSKEEVELLLGEPAYSPIEGQFYYSTKTNSLFSGCVIGAVLEYRIINYNGDDITAAQTGKLESIYLGEICE